MSKHTFIIIVIASLLTACVRKVEEQGPTASSNANEATVEKGTEPGAQDSPAEKPAPVSYAPSPKAADWNIPSQVKVQHILIGVAGSRLPKPNLPSPAEAEKLSRSLCDRIRAGEDMGALVKEFTNDSFPGIYTMITTGRPNHPALIFMRQEMAKSFGDVSYALDVGECAIANYDPNPDARKSKSPFGFHIIKRLE